MSDADVTQAQRHLVADVDKIIYENMFSMPYNVCCELSDAFDELGAEIENLQAENAKLRELAERAWKTAERLCQAFDGPCRADDVTAYKPCPMGERDEECVYGQLQRELRELGVEE